MDGIWHKNKLGEINPMLKKEKPWDMIEDLIELYMKPLIDHLQHYNKGTYFFWESFINGQLL